MAQEQRNNPLHGIKLEALVTELVDHYGFQVLAEELNLNCFKSNPSVKSTLKFLRRTEWARERVERFYLYDYKQLPEPGYDEFETPARQRTISDEQKDNMQTRPKVPHKPHKPRELREQTLANKDDSNSSDSSNEKPLSSSSPWAKSKHLKK